MSETETSNILVSRKWVEQAQTKVNALVAALGYMPEQIDLSLPRFKDADDSDTVAIEVTVGWLREVRAALKLAEGDPA